MGVGQIKILFGAGHADIKKAASLLGVGLHTGQTKRERTLFTSRNKNNGEFQTLDLCSVIKRLSQTLNSKWSSGFCKAIRSASSRDAVFLEEINDPFPVGRELGVTLKQGYAFFRFRETFKGIGGIGMRHRFGIRADSIDGLKRNRQRLIAANLVRIPLRSKACLSAFFCAFRR